MYEYCQYLEFTKNKNKRKKKDKFDESNIDESIDKILKPKKKNK